MMEPVMKMARLVAVFVVVTGWVLGPVHGAEAIPRTPEQIESWWKAGRTLPLETTALYPLPEQRVVNDTGINVLIDMSHKCDFFTLWTLGGYLNQRGLRTIGSHATIDSVIRPGSVCRIRIPVASKVWPFAWWKPPRFNVVLTEGAVRYPQYLPAEREALVDFVRTGGGLVVCGATVRDAEEQARWSLNALLREFGAGVQAGSQRYEGRRYPRLGATRDWEVVLKGDEGLPIYARRTFGKGRVVLLASSGLYRFDRKQREQAAERADWLAAVIRWAAGGSEPVGGTRRFPVARGGGGGIYPESEERLPGIVCFYSKNQDETLLRTLQKDFPAITEDLYAWLPSPKPTEPMYLLLCSGSGGGWAVNAYLPKETATISTSPGGIRSIFAHEQAHTMSGPCAAANHPFGGNQGEEHAGWFQGKINAKYNGDTGPNRGCQRVIRKDYQPGTRRPEEIFVAERLEAWATGWDRMMIWYVWQKLDDRYGPTWYPRWRWVQGQRWKATPGKKLSWEEAIEDMSIAVGEDLFPFFAKTGKRLSKERFARAEFMGRTIELPVAPIEPTPPGDVCLDPIGDYTQPIRPRQ